MESGPRSEKQERATKNIIPRKKNGSEGKRKRNDKRRKKRKTREREREHTLNKRINPPVARRER